VTAIGPSAVYVADDGGRGGLASFAAVVEPPAIEFVSVYAQRSQTPTLRGVSFAVDRGSITAIVGGRGAGKSSCVRLALGLDLPQAGDVIVTGRSVPSLKGRRLAKLRARFGVLFEAGAEGDCALFAGMNVFDNVAVPMRAAGSTREAEVRRRTLERLDEVGLTGCGDAMPTELPASMRKRAALARALAARPELALLDGLDADFDDDLYDVIRERREADGGTYLVTSRDAAVARRLADQVVELVEGRVVG
jgi:phospholipid/cholesterol/gamma-HCH transport system ATP-binding protein